MKYTENFIYVQRPYRTFVTSCYQSKNYFSKYSIKQKILWDNELPIDIANDWANIINSLNDIQETKIPKKAIFQNNVIKSIKLHGFSDASFQGYGACIYFRTLYESGDISVNLVLGKSRVAPLKETTIPRMKLLGNLILSRLMNTVYNALKK